MEPAKTISPAIKALIVIVLIGIVATAVIVINTSSQTKQAPTTSQENPTTSSGSSSASTALYKDGTYSATGSYSTPGGRESIDLTVTIADGVITSTTLKENATSGEAKEHQDDFASGYKSLVVGKKVNDISLSRVAGSSLTSNGFNTALDDIKKDAAA